jgi:chorismate-pyruvate lyase
MDTVLASPPWLSGSAADYFVDAALVESTRLPQLYHALLTPSGSMTERLEHHFGKPMGIKVLSMSTSGDRYVRWVVMFDPAQRSIAMAGISLAIDTFGEALRAEILHGKQPLGRLLTQHGLAYESVPQAFFALTPTTLTGHLLQMGETVPIFGRRAELYVCGTKCGDIVEALPRYDRQRAVRP